MSLKRSGRMTRAALIKDYGTPPEILDAPVDVLVPLWVIQTGGRMRSGERYDDATLHVARTLWHLHDVMDEDNPTQTIFLKPEYANH